MAYGRWQSCMGWVSLKTKLKMIQSKRRQKPIERPSCATRTFAPWATTSFISKLSDTYDVESFGAMMRGYGIPTTKPYAGRR